MTTPSKTSDRAPLFKDYFSHDSFAYSKIRPGYPDALFSYLSSITKGQKLAWDCATGSGQAAILLAQHFDKVIATDASSSQIANAHKHEAVHYAVARAEDSGIDSNSLDIITVAQAIHWFDIAAYTDEVNRTLKDGGILAAWTYNLLNIRTDIDAVINYLYSKILDDYWPQERRLVEQRYASIDLPFTELSIPEFNMTLNWNFTQLIAYLSTWSAVNAYISANTDNPLDIIHDKLLEQWGNRDTVMAVSWPLTVKVWRKP